MRKLRCKVLGHRFQRSLSASFEHRQGHWMEDSGVIEYEWIETCKRCGVHQQWRSNILGGPYKVGGEYA